MQRQFFPLAWGFETPIYPFSLQSNRSRGEMTRPITRTSIGNIRQTRRVISSSSIHEGRWPWTVTRKRMLFDQTRTDARPDM